MMHFYIKKPTSDNIFSWIRRTSKKVEGHEAMYTYYISLLGVIKLHFSTVEDFR